MQEIWTIKRVLDWTVEHFKKRQVPESRLSAELLLAHVLNCKRISLYLQFDRILTSSELKIYRNYINRRSRFEPIQYILGEHEFMGLTFKITPDVLVPRSETELLVETVLNDLNKTVNRDTRILDVGTGSGIIAIALAKFSKSCRISAIDMDPACIKVAKFNASQIGVSGINFQIQDARKMKPESFEKYDIIVSNPPYVAETDRINMHPQVLDFEPPIALFAGPEGLDFYRSFMPVASGLLTENGLVYMEIGYNQKEKILALFKEHNFINIEFIQDYQKIDRIVKAEI